MGFSAEAYGPEVAAILALDGGGERLMPLAGGACSSPEALASLRAAGVRTLFAAARAPEAALAGLYLYFSCLDECHAIAQAIATPEGSYWHAIMHRRSPTPATPATGSDAWAHTPSFPPCWRQPRRSVTPRAPAGTRSCSSNSASGARLRPDSTDERLALAVQRSEWQLLFDYCAAPGAGRLI